MAVLGPGGVGGLVAALRARRGDQVPCLAPPATAAHLAAHGLELRSKALGPNESLDLITQLAEHHE